MLRFLLISGLVALGSAASAGVFDDPENLEVLDEDITTDQLRETMKGFSMGLGVRCSHCHVGEPDAPLEEYDFAADDKETKEIARKMIRMVREINARHIANLGREASELIEVECVTCHRGQNRPLLLGGHLTAALDEGGLPEMLQRYDTLRSRYYGSHAIDFSEWGVIGVAQDFAARGEIAAARALLDRHARDEPDSVWTQVRLAQYALRGGDAAAARIHAERVRELDPGNPSLPRILDEIERSSDR